MVSGGSGTKPKHPKHGKLCMDSIESNEEPRACYRIISLTGQDRTGHVMGISTFSREFVFLAEWNYFFRMSCVKLDRWVRSEKFQIRGSLIYTLFLIELNITLIRWILVHSILIFLVIWLALCGFRICLVIWCKNLDSLLNFIFLK